MTLSTKNTKNTKNTKQKARRHLCFVFFVFFVHRFSKPTLAPRAFPRDARLHMRRRVSLTERFFNLTLDAARNFVPTLNVP